MPSEGCLISGFDHVCLPSFQDDWSKIIEFWESIGLVCEIYEVTDSNYDHAGKGKRLLVYAGRKLMISYYVLSDKDCKIQIMMEMMHVALKVTPPSIKFIRNHESFDRETKWGNSNISVFLNGPFGIHVELVTIDPEYHQDQN